MEYFRLPVIDDHRCEYSDCGKKATILQIDEGHEHLVCNSHTFHDYLPAPLIERGPKPLLPHHKLMDAQVGAGLAR
jgi:hypothetical protein